MLDSAKTKNVIEATNKPRLFEKLEDLQKRFVFISLHLIILYIVLCFVLSIRILCLSTDWHYVKKLLLSTWRQRDLPFRDSTLFHLQTCWTSFLKGVVPQRYIYTEFTSISVFSIYPVTLFHNVMCYNEMI